MASIAIRAIIAGFLVSAAIRPMPPLLRIRVIVFRVISLITQ
ncbi:hypothetical protein X773_33465 [Mesorhizobium sp. LSJC285A00]|nr:hypothetical protein X773_33465 [Mesorhizobium sp. LSJC285A00]